jgi:predicted dehydrogenase
VTVRASIIGLGRSGWHIHADAMAEHPGFDVVAVADPVAERRDEAVARFGCAAFAEPSGAIDGDVDLVVVATTSDTHVPLALRALAAGRHVVVEKPMARTVAEVDAMIDAARAAGRLLTCYQQRRLDPDFEAVRGVVSSGRLGRLVLVRRVIHDFTRRADWQTLRRFNGGALSNTVPHLLDQVLRFTDPAVTFELLADLRHTVGAGDAEDHVKLALRPVGDGPLLEVEASSTVALPQPEWLVIGTAGAISASPPEMTVRWSDPRTWRPLTIDDGPAAGRRYGTDETLEWVDERIAIPAGGRSATLRFYDNLEASMRGDADPLVTPESVRRQIDILERARAQTGYR